ncbi:uncharacterized protein OCT59_026165 [Rhizophagus irregularis]|uniref:MATA-HMG n=1 Tax=Rhizophagus irregularis (strain DAOM 181602 / DAOM 197198 / MUCL 43194) TaxID=747089 RepID=A0A2P4QCP8_RHIID|nr:hypothetical protein GLOIN_2v1770281 [Rhizophagus irregularis DAOM 181602=DAOM 197198]POG75405.1 hypothetical protein GLOIN_2v1770281 [Rhizophagus irregularis DAOM 181602=DAOM 197198]UZO05826.1 hypothetical protein OCT59_026165 [Rhizophagus irregularis]GET50404.1 hypothetical protein GLOIN_2v1770281 [Rhizophagus irregularis DAOM 181602=DAOM 197198]|eukprot:XP_025182271.1 hypothetical protein GLOIN_2v1770281 [Rhizophagus irregularis DAOM 181602=DAOM 197198]
MSSLNQEVQMLHHEVANGMQLFPPPINNPKDFEDTVKSFKPKPSRRKVHIMSLTLLNFFIKKQAQRIYKKCVVDKVVRELWNSTTANNKIIYKELCKQINSRINSRIGG